MSKIQTQNPGSSEIQSPLIAGITDGLNKLSGVLELKVGTLSDVKLTAVSIDSSSDNKNRIYEAGLGNKLWLSSPAPVFKKNGTVITQEKDNFSIDYVGGSITFSALNKPSDSDEITVSCSYIVGESETISQITNTLTATTNQANKYKGNYNDLSSLKLAHSTAKNGDFAIVFSPLAVYAWKNDGWYDTRSIEDLSDYYTKSEADNLLNQKEPKFAAKGSSTSDDNYYWGGRKTWQDLFAKVRSVTLTGLSTASDAVVTATDTVLSAIGKLQSQASKIFINGTGSPTTGTKGIVGQRYVNTSTSEEYFCESDSNGTYNWSQTVKSVNSVKPSKNNNVELSPYDVGAYSEQEINELLFGKPVEFDTTETNNVEYSEPNRIGNVTVEGFTAQTGSGDPSPDNVRPIQNAGGYTKRLHWNGQTAVASVGTNAKGLYRATITLPADFQVPGAFDRPYILCSGLTPVSANDAQNLEEYGYLAAYNSTWWLFLSPEVRDISSAQEYLSKHPITVAYQSAQDTGEYYTGVEVTQGDEYRCEIIELQAPLHEGDMLETNVQSEYDAYAEFDGSSDESWVLESGAATGQSGSKWLWIKFSGPQVRSTTDTEVPSAASNFLLADSSQNTYTAKSEDTFSLAYSSGNILQVRVAGIATVESLKTHLQSHPLRVFYKSTSGGTPKNIKREEHVKKTYVFTGNEDFRLNSGGTYPYFSFVSGFNFTSKIKGVCSHFPVVSISASNNNKGIDGFDGVVYIRWDGIDTVEQLKDLLSQQYAADTPCVIECELAAPEVYADKPVEVKNPRGAFTVSCENGTQISTTFKSVTDANLLDGHSWNEIKLESPVQSINSKTGNVVLTAEDVEAISNKNASYSTSEEIDTGKAWIDGKPIYRKSYAVAAFPNKESVNVPLNISNLGQVVDYYGIASNGTTTIRVPYYSVDGDAYGIQISISNNSTLVLKTNGSGNRSDYSGTVTVEYTKGG